MIYVFVDVDGTLIDHSGNRRPYYEALLNAARMKSANGEEASLVVWSHGGAKYAAEQVPYEYASAFMYKDHQVLAMFTKMWPESVMVVDNDNRFLELCERCMRWWVPTYDKSLHPKDTHLLKVTQDIMDIKGYQ